MTIEELMSYEKEDLKSAAEKLSAFEIPFLIERLNDKNEPVRYKASLLLQQRSMLKNDVYPFWDEFVSRLTSANAFIRSIGLIFISENARWDDEGKLDKIIDGYLTFCDDEKPMVVRLCIQGLVKIVKYRHKYDDRIINKLVSIDIFERKDTQRKLITMDIAGVFAVIYERDKREDIKGFFIKALGYDFMDNKSRAEITKIKL